MVLKRTLGCTLGPFTQHVWQKERLGCLLWSFLSRVIGRWADGQQIPWLKNSCASLNDTGTPTGVPGHDGVPFSCETRIKGPALPQHDAWKEIKMNNPSYGTSVNRAFNSIPFPGCYWKPHNESNKYSLYFVQPWVVRGEDLQGIWS